VQIIFKNKIADGIVTFVFDIVYSAIIAVLMLLAAYQSAEGHIRWYNFLFFIAIDLIFVKTAGKYFLSC